MSTATLSRPAALKHIDERRLEADLGYRFGYVSEFMGFGPEDIEAIHGMAPHLAPLVEDEGHHPGRHVIAVARLAFGHPRVQLLHRVVLKVAVGRDIERLVDAMNPAHEYKFAELIELGRDNRLFARLIPEEGEMDPPHKQRLSLLIRKYIGRIFSSHLRFDLIGDTRGTERFIVTEMKAKIT